MPSSVGVEPLAETAECCEDPQPLELGDKVPEVHEYTHRCMTCMTPLKEDGDD